jgi:8-oxo-dGTP diphosphatase
MKVIEKIGLAMIRDGRLLIVRKKATALFLMPGGKPEPDENEVSTLEREIKEETMGTLQVDNLRFFGQFADFAANDPGAEVRMKVYVGSISGKISPSNEIAEYRWFDPHSDDWNILSDIIKNHILPALLQAEML